MLESKLSVNYLLFIYNYLRIFLDLSGSFNLLLNSENNNYTISKGGEEVVRSSPGAQLPRAALGINLQSAENYKGFSEAIRQSFNSFAHPPYTHTKDMNKDIYEDEPSGARFIACEATSYIWNRAAPYNKDKRALKSGFWPEAITHKSALPGYCRLASFRGQARPYSHKTFPHTKHNNSSSNFYAWLAGIIDAKGNFDISSTLVLKAIRIRLHNRDIRILTRIQDTLHMGRIINHKNKFYSTYIVSNEINMSYLVNKLNGIIRIKCDSLEKACALYNIDFIKPDYNIKCHDPYFSGLIDAKGSIVFNFTSNRIECNLQVKHNNFTSKLNFDNIILFCKPYTQYSKDLKYISFKFQSVKGMTPLYEYFMINRLYSDYKFYRVSLIKKFLAIRNYKKTNWDSIEYKIYSDFLLKWIQYRNPLWTRVGFINKLRGPQA